MRRFLFLILPFLALFPDVAAQELSHRAVNRALDARIRQSSVFADGHTGFALYDLDAERPVYGYQASRYFVPASNTKLITFLVANRLLSDGAPAIIYRDTAGRTDLWGSGYPLLLHPAFAGYDSLRGWLQQHGRPLTLHFPAAEELPRYGAGWSWDDYPFGFVFERTALPVYGNRLYLDYRPGPGGREALYGSPPSVAETIVRDPAQERTISRREGSNRFTVGPGFDRRTAFPIQRSLTMDTATTVALLREGLSGVSVRSGTAPRPADADSLRVPVPDTLYRSLLLDSDNFLAEQLVLLCASARYGGPDEERLFDWVTDTLFREMELGEVSYRDGSGLTRYNLLRPAQLVEIVAALDREVGRDRLRTLLPAGGVSGTLRNRFANRPEPYVWAKTGTLTGVIAVSGLLRTASGRWLAFSFMHNNVMSSSRDYYAEMEGVMEWIRANL